MGAQQMKATSSQLKLDAAQRYTYDLTQQAETQVLTVLPNKSSISKQLITVANFAKIKMEPPENVSTEVEPLTKKFKLEDHNDFDNSEDTLDANVISVHDLANNCVELKKELIEASVEGSLEIVNQKNAISCKISNVEISEGSLCTDESLVQVQDHRPINNENIQETKIVEDLVESTNRANKTKLVRNPFALFKSCDKVPNQKRSSNTTSNSEPIILEEDLDISSFSVPKKSFLNISLKSEPIILDDELETSSPSLPTINHNQLVIKSEDIRVNETIQETDNSTSLHQNFFSFNLSSSLDGNFSERNTDFEESSSKHSIEDVTESKYFSTIEISSEENEKNENKNIKARRKRKPHKTNACSGSKLRKTFNLRRKYQRITRQQNKIATKDKTKKRTEKDSLFKSGFKKNTILKNLPKRIIKTRKKVKNCNVKKGKTSTQVEFPKPLKLETHTSHKDNSIVAVELPKPIKVKREFNLNTKNKISYLRPEYQPIVRLKRLASDELLVPLRTKHARRTRTYRSAYNNKRDFLIQQAFSLHPYIKLNRLSIDQDHSLTEMQNESLSEMESKYFSIRERLSLFPSSTPDGSSMLSGAADSGFSTSTPSTSRHSLNYDNKTLLLEIAAERAFINNHLTQFGYSPMQFELYNNFNDLTVFLKYLFGNLNGN